jgi:hypothetical protein
MSVVLLGSTSGSCTLQEQAVAGTTVLTLPTTSGTVLTSTSPSSDLPSSINGPAFSAFQNASVSVANATFTKLPINTETFDTNSAFDSTTNYRFTPLVGGYYQINGCMNYMAGTGGGNLFVSIYKNGSEYRRGAAQTVVGGLSSNVSDVVFLNGSTDYIELYVYQSSGTTQTYGPATPLTYFSGVMVRGA